ncbi:hypothetical protein AB1Y20_001283 [Prymnesium parvum]|uniref:Beta-carotene isomerase D27-like C-terminal domain-containing protein n=1 Tax=Prymnesium parvum TaxID=97485 RepID=A0AB34K888_PRYPA
MIGRAAIARAAAAGSSALYRQPEGVQDLLELSNELLRLRATPLAMAELTDAIDQTGGVREATPSALSSIADFLRRSRRKLLLADMLRDDRTAYLEAVSFLPIPRRELPNVQGVPIRACDAALYSVEGTAAEAAAVHAEGLVPDCALPVEPMGENFVEGVLLRVTRNIYAEEVSGGRDATPGIRGLLEEMRRFMLSPEGVEPSAQQLAVLNTLKRLMTPVLPPFYRIFMGGIVPSSARGDPQWLEAGVQRGVQLVDKLPFDAKGILAPGKQLGPLPYAPFLTSIVAPFAFGFLVGPSQVNLRSDGKLGGLVVKKCKFLQESNCKGMCLNSCKLPAQQLFDELGVPLRVSPNFETQECQWSFGEVAPRPSEDETWPKGCIVGCGSRAAVKELQIQYNVAPCI